MMIFSVTIGSNGKGAERYVLYIPFTISPGRKIQNINFEDKISLDRYELGFENAKHHYAITVGTFSTEDEAGCFYQKIRSAFFWISLKHLIGVNSPLELSKFRLNENPIQISDKSNFKGIAAYAGWKTIDGSYDSHQCIVRPENKKLVRWEGGQAKVTAGLGVGNFVETIQEALSFSNPENIVNNPKLKLSIELYSSFFFEQSSESKFIRLVTVLEALTPDEKISEFSVGVLKHIKLITKSLRSEYEVNSIEHDEINHLLSRIGQLKYKSIGKSLNNFIRNILKRDSNLGDETEILGELANLYNLRSKLLHEGNSDQQSIQNSLQFLTNFVPKLLQFLYIDNANNTK